MNVPARPLFREELPHRYGVFLRRRGSKQYVVKQKVAPVRVKERITVGAVLPSDVELRAVPSDWGLSVSNYRYVYYDDHVVLVEPSNRRVVQIIE